MTAIDDFNEEQYLIENPDVSEALRRGVLTSARAHYEQYGKAEIESGARHPCTKRVTLAFQFLAGVGIEIGALHNPLRVPSTATVRYVDRLSKPDLYLHYPELSAYNLVDVDVIDNGEDLITFQPSSQDFIVANHFLEHCENPIKTLRNFMRVLKEMGVLYLAVPEHKAYFDKERSVTSLKHLIDDDKFGPELSRSQHFLEWAQYVEGTHVTLAELRARAETLDRKNYSIHYHVWDRTHFEQFLNYAKDHLGFKIEVLEQVDGEIIAIIRKN